MTRPEVTGRRAHHGAAPAILKEKEDEDDADEPDVSETKRKVMTKRRAPHLPALKPSALALRAPRKPRRKPDRKPASVPVREGEVDAFSIAEFCRRHRISVATFYKKPDQMPKTFQIGVRRLVSKEAAAEWRRKMEKKANS